MAYVSKETTKAIRDKLKAEFGNTVKFLVTKNNSMSLSVFIEKSPYFDDGETAIVNMFHIDSYYKGETADFLKKVNAIIRSAGKWYDNSDVMTDYFDTAFYYHVFIGTNNTPHEKI